MSRVSDAIVELKNAMIEEGVDPTKGLPLELFEFSTGLLPFVNVDLLITNEKDQILLSWRDDRYYGTGWQIPGGIIRMMETIDDRIQNTAVNEIGCRVEYQKTPIVVHQNIIRKHREGLENQLERAHNIALLYKCRVPEGYLIDNKGRTESDEGYLCWFGKFPEDLLECHHSLREYDMFKKWF